MLFDGEGAGASATAPTPGQGTSTVSAANGQQQQPSVVVYGKQETNTAGANTQAQPEGNTITPEEKQAAYAKFKAEYKDLYDTDVQGHIKQRLGKYKQYEAQVAQVNPLLDVLSEIYGTNDISDLINKVQGESLQAAAEEAGMTVEQYKKVLNLKLENKRLAQKDQSEQEARILNEKIKGWYDEADKVKEQYPDFDLKQWSGNDDFVKLLEAGISVKSAYEVCNIDGIKAQTAKQAETNTVNNIKSRNQRPFEAALNQTPGVIVKNDPSSLTKADREEIAKRAARGEKIVF